MEYFDIVDMNGVPTGGIVERNEAHAKGIPHRSAHIWIIKREGGMVYVLLQKRSMMKDSYPGKWDISSAGHMQAGDEPLESALREMSEELGIEAQPGELTPIGNFRIDTAGEFYGRPFINREYVFSYVYEKPVDTAKLVLQPEELADAAWFPLGETIERVLKNDDELCISYDGIALLKKYAEALGEKL